MRQPIRELFVVALATIVVAVAGCSSLGGATSPEPTAAAGIEQLRYSCGRFPFEAGLIRAAPGTDELAATPVAAALRAHLAIPGPDTDFLPDHGWTLVGIDATTAEYVTVGGDLGMKSVDLELAAGGWKVSGWGDCRPLLVLPAGVGAAVWSWGGPGVPGPGTRTFDALVSEMACASGRSPVGRIVGPDVIATTDTVLVVFAVRQLGGTQDCPGIPPTRVPVDLGVTLGTRKLLDGGRLPYGDPLAPAP